MISTQIIKVPLCGISQKGPEFISHWCPPGTGPEDKPREEHNHTTNKQKKLPK